jgi:hypothetical protein
MTTSNTDGSSRHSECQQCASMLHALGQVLGSSLATSGTIKDRNGNATVTFTYTPTAAS